MTLCSQRYVVRLGRCVLVLDLPGKQVRSILVEEVEDLGHPVTESVGG